uniref:Uncharacterized protein n=1 Tax=Fagus sylvatica TaxID=28930 RepID=A0A2N9GT17_FAGSY
MSGGGDNGGEMGENGGGERLMGLLKVPVPPSAPNPGTHSPGSTPSHRKTPPPRTMPDGKVTSIP